MTTGIVELESPAESASIYEIGAEVGDPGIEEIASLLWHDGTASAHSAAEVDVDPWARACCCCGDDQEEALVARSADDARSRAGAPLIIVVSPFLPDEWSDPLSAEEVVFGVRVKSRRDRSRRLEPVWIC